MANSRNRLGLILGLIVVVLLLGWAGRIVLALHQDKVWAWKVRGNLNVEETRRWALNTQKFYSETNDYRNFAAWLTNAPKILVESYKRAPMVIAQDFDGKDYMVSLRYGGGFYDWGLTISDTNLPPTVGRGSHVKQWAPGINFWNN